MGSRSGDQGGGRSTSEQGGFRQMNIQPFSINIAQAALDDLQDRLARTRWPDRFLDILICPTYLVGLSDLTKNNSS
jgi:hypothetical protein